MRGENDYLVKKLIFEEKNVKRGKKKEISAP